MANHLIVLASSRSFCIGLSFIDLKLVSFELVLRYLFVSPLAIAFMIEGA